MKLLLKQGFNNSMEACAIESEEDARKVADKLHKKKGKRVLMFNLDKLPTHMPVDVPDSNHDVQWHKVTPQWLTQNNIDPFKPEVTWN